MNAVKALFGWIGRKGVVFLLLVAALVAYRLLQPSYDSYNELRTKVAGLERGAGELDAFVRTATSDSDAAVAVAHRLTRGQIVDRLAAARAKRGVSARSCGGDLGALLARGAGGVVGNRKACVLLALTDREIAALSAVETTLDARRGGEPLPDAVRRHAATMRVAARDNAAAVARVRQIDEGFFGGLGNGRARAAEIERARRSQGDFAAAKRNGAALVAAQGGVATAARTASAQVSSTTAAYAALLADRRKQLGDNAVEQARGFADRVGLVDILRTAALILLGVILSPYLIRTLFWFVLAPIAERRPAIRIAVSGGGAPVAPAPRSTASVGVRLGPGEELLVRQGYLQSTSPLSDRADRWLLDWRHPLSSVAAGLGFLTRIRGDGELTTVSAVADPFAEVTVLELPDGAACVLHPRALAAAAKPIERRLRITSRWRLGSLNAWLTLQLRFLVFHGPARLVVKGGRGVRVERATRGRVFGQDQLVGFSADLAYSVARTDTFRPYLFGLVPLFRDTVADGDGVVVIEEAPMAGRGRAGPRRGLEGAMDAALKVFGV